MNWDGDKTCHCVTNNPCPKHAEEFYRRIKEDIENPPKKRICPCCGGRGEIEDRRR